MTELMLKAISIVSAFVLCGSFAFVLACWTIKTWWNTPLLILGFWAVIVLIALLLGWPKKKGQSSPD